MSNLPSILFTVAAANFIVAFSFANSALLMAESRPNIILVMADDQGWGQTGYYGHPILKTPNLDAMAEAGLRFDRFYAAAPVCSPTRASVLTGRSNMRTGVESHGYALRRQEKTVAAALRDAGYATGHFGKWHLNGMRGPGVPIFKTDSHHPGKFGFDKWLSVTNFFDRDPILSRQGDFTEFKGDSSEIIVDEALDFIRAQAAANVPSFSVIWYGTPHDPFRAAEADMKPFEALNEPSKHQHGELVAMDRSIGTLRKGLRKLKIADNTLIWYCSDNGGLGINRIQPDTVGGLRGHKSTMYEGGLRVPAVIEWPSVIKPRITNYPAVVMDIFPTLVEIVGLAEEAMLQPQDGVSLKPLFTQEISRREKNIPFACFGNTVILDNNLKLLHLSEKRDGAKRYELYDLSTDPKERHNLITERPQAAKRLQQAMDKWKASVDHSFAGKDYAEGKLLPGDPAPRFWMGLDAYRPFFSEWRTRPEYRSRLKRQE